MYIVQWRKDGTYLTRIDPSTHEAYWSNYRDDAIVFTSEENFRNYAISQFNYSDPHDRVYIIDWMIDCKLLQVESNPQACYVIRQRFHTYLFMEKIHGNICDWGSLKSAKTFLSEADAIDYVSINSPGADRDGVLYWLRQNCVIQFMHPMNLKLARER